MQKIRVADFVASFIKKIGVDCVFMVPGGGAMFLNDAIQCKKDSKKGCNGKSSKCITHNLWDELEIHIQHFFNKKNLGDLIKGNNENRI